MGLSTLDESLWRHGCWRENRWEPLDVEAAALASSVAVMAPALTEGGPQKPDNLLPSLPVGGFLSPKEASQVYQKREVLAKFVVSANVQPSKIDDQFLLGISKDLIRDVINSKYVTGLDNLPGFANGSNLIANKELAEVKEVRRAVIVPDCSEPQTTNTIMNNSSSMDDQTKEMCFLKSNVDENVPLTDSAVEAAAEVAAEVAASEVDQIMGFDEKISADPNVSEVTDMGQNVDDILQVIKSWEGAENTENINEVASSSEPAPSVSDSIEMFTGSEIFPSFEQNLLNEEDFEGLCTEAYNNPVDDITLKAHDLNNVTQNQFHNERRCAFLLRRLHKLQARLIGKHIAEENTGVLELAHNGVKKYFFQELLSGIGSKTVAKSNTEVNSSMQSFVEKIEKTCVAQSSNVSRQQRAYCRYFGAGSRDNVNTAIGNSNRHPAFTASQLNIKGDEVENVAGPLASHLHLVESNLDSDCTLSSSGGESCDEMQPYNNPHQQSLSILKRAGWRYAQDRASIASRWTWLQAQISDLEYRIRQHNELQRHIRATKGLVILDNAETVNGYNGVLPGSTTGRCSSQEGGEPMASRTRPFMRNVYKKRKLLKINRLHEFSKRAARASTLRCGCDHSLPPCALCTGRLDPTQPQEPLEQLSIPERVAMVDPSFHPVLSFPDDILQGTHLEAIMKSVDWQQKMIRGNVRMSRIKDKETNEKRSKKLPEQRTKYTSRLKKSTSSIVTSRIKRKVLKGKRRRISRDRSVHGLSRKRVSKLPTVEDDEEVGALSSSSKHSSPVPSPLQPIAASSSEKIPSIKEKISSSHSRLKNNSYDIDNIVIPYSVAAATRLEKLQYKEILTPKWRLCEEPHKIDFKNGVMHTPSQDSDFEDVSDEAVALRHGRSEREEYKRFMTFVNATSHPHRMRHRRTDSRADSGTNTPDPMSPHASDFGGDTTSPITSPPPTPSNVQDSEQADSYRPLQHTLRRRTISSLRLMREDREKERDKDKESMVPNTEEEKVKEIAPYDPRTFPLSDDVYDRMLEVMPEGHCQPPESISSREVDKMDDDIEIGDHESDSTESTYFEVEGEDPNDPEWTVADDRDTEKERIRPTVKR